MFVILPWGVVEDVRNSDDLVCLDLKSKHDSNAILSLALYYAYEKHDRSVAIKYFEKLAAIGNHAIGLEKYAHFLGRGDEKYIVLLNKAFELRQDNSVRVAQQIFSFYRDANHNENAYKWAKIASDGCSLIGLNYIIENANDESEIFFSILVELMRAPHSDKSVAVAKKYFESNADKIDFNTIVSFFSNKQCSSRLTLDEIRAKESTRYFYENFSEIEINQ